MNFASIREKIAYFRAHSFVRNALTLQAGSVSANVIQALIGILLARILQPERYGIYALSFGLAGLISVFLGVGAQDAVTTILGERYARRDREGIADALAFLGKISVMTAGLALLGALAAPMIGNLFYDDYNVGIYAAVIVCGSILSTGFYSFTTIALQVVGEIRSLTVLGFVDQLLRSVLSLTFVALGLGVAGSVSGHFLGAAILFVASAFIWKGIQRRYPLLPSVREIVRHVRHVRIAPYLGFSFWIAVDRNIANLYNILPVLITGMFVASSEVTFFKLAFAYVNLALSFLGPISTLLNVSFPKMKVDSSDRLGKNFVKVSLYSLGLSAILTAGALIVAPLAFRIMYGPNFTASVHYVFGLFAYGSLMGIGVGLGPMWRALNKVKISIAINLGTLILGIPLGVWLIAQYGLWGTVVMVSIWFTVSHWISFIYLARHLAVRERIA